jgi:Asp-tRNA(Asn)/Glu-tRNA(Gln) amidotransferase A subunit family amidase
MIETAPAITDPTGLSASELARAIADRRLTARDAVEAHIARIEAVNPGLNAVVVKRYDQARSEADAADRALREDRLRGPLHGVPITLKEQFTAAGMPASIGVAGAAPDDHDGPLVARLRAAGAIVLGKTNVPQLLLYNESDNPVYGRTNNPADPARSCGGSSGGEAAIIAAHGSPLGLGSDIGGSLRTPSHACGIAALKPTSGRLTNEDARLSPTSRSRCASSPRRARTRSIRSSRRFRGASPVRSTSRRCASRTMRTTVTSRRRPPCGARCARRSLRSNCTARPSSASRRPMSPVR